MDVRNVFISSRMADLARERHGAYHGVCDARLIPLAYEGELPAGSKPLMDRLVDMADLFLGIYSHRGGNRRKELHELTPLEYEFYRFMARHKLFQTTRRLTTHDSEMRSRIDAVMSNRDEFNKLKLELKTQCRSSGHLKDTLLNRVRLFVMEGADGGRSPPKGLDFLSIVPERCRPTFCTEKAQGKPFARLPTPAHVTLYLKVSKYLIRAIESRGLNIGQAGIAGCRRIRFAVRCRDCKSLLLAVLEACFQGGLNLLGLHGGLTGDGDCFVEGTVVPFFEFLEDERDLKHACDLLQDDLRYRCHTCSAKVAFESDADQGTSEVDVWASRLPRRAVLMADVLDVPGSLWSVASVIHHATLEPGGVCIDYLAGDHRAADRPFDGRARPVTIGLSAAMEPREWHATVRRIEYHVRSLMCVMSATCGEPPADWPSKAKAARPDAGLGGGIVSAQERHGDSNSDLSVGAP